MRKSNTVSPYLVDQLLRRSSQHPSYLVDQLLLNFFGWADSDAPDWWCLFPSSPPCRQLAFSVIVGASRGDFGLE